MGVIRALWGALTADPFFREVREVRWSHASSGDGASLTLHNPSDHKVELLGVLLRRPPTEGSHGSWYPADRLVLSAKRGEPTVLHRPVLRHLKEPMVWPKEDLSLDLPRTVPPHLVEALVLSSLYRGSAVKQWSVDEQGAVEVLRDDTVWVGGAGDAVDGVFRLLG